MEGVQTPGREGAPLEPGNTSLLCHSRVCACVRARVSSQAARPDGSFIWAAGVDCGLLPR